MAEVIASTLIEAVFKKLADKAVEQVGRVKGIHSELKSLEETLSCIQALLVDASNKEIKQVPVQKWLNDLNHLAYDIDDILDDLATDAMHPQFAKKPRASSSKVKKLIASCFINLSLCTKTYHRLDKINLLLQELENGKTKIGLTVKNGELEVRNHRSIDKNRVLETSVLDTSIIIVGRQGVKDEFIDKLLDDDPRNKNFSVVPIVGIGGVGKTTLARILYNDEQVHSHFDLKAWVCVSDNWDSVQISKSIFEYFNLSGGDKKFENFSLLQEALVKQLREKKFLLVLDDVWTESDKDWETLVRPFSVCARGSKVIITTRKDQLLKELGCGQLNPLQCLSPDDAVSLFCQHALDANNFDLYPTLKPHGQDIVGRCKGLPLALIALGRLLRRKDDEGWKEMVDSEIWSLKEGGGIIPALKLSYHELPASLKQLFAYCSLFPKDDLFEKDGLVLLWMAEGFLHQSDHSSKTEESLGRDYFEELLSRSFFQQAPDDESLFVMHDLMHDLATSVAGEFFFRLEKGMGNNLDKLTLEKLRHMSFFRQEYEAYKKFKEGNCLRTFLSVGVTKRSRIHVMPDNVLVDLLPRLPLLRVLNLSIYNIYEVPECIGSLKHLRYINLSRTNIRNLPETVCDLTNLQTLIVSGCSSLAKLPKNFSKLKNLRHLDIRDTPRLQDMPLGIGELKSLQTLSKIIIGGEDDFSITQLKDFKDLRGSVSIKGLNKVKEATAREANLSQKKINELELEWSGNASVGMEVLDALKPYGGLKELGIVNYCGSVFPKWVADTSFHRLGRVSMRGCKNCTSLPPFAHLPSLKKLSIKDMNNVKVVGSEFLGNGVSFPSLEILKFKGMSGWEKWSGNGRSTTGVVRDVFPRLKELHIEDCPSLVKFSFEGDKVFPCLKELRIERFPSLVEFSFEGNELFSCLKVLHIFYCPCLDEVSFKGDKVFPFLQELHIALCFNLIEVSVEELPSLRVLEIERCGAGVLRSLVRAAAPSVTKLKIGSISGLSNEVWRGVILNLKAVEELEIKSCYEIRYLWDPKEAEASNKFFMNLRKLKVCMCQNLVSLGEKDEEQLNNGEGGEQNMGKSMPISDHPNVVGFGGNFIHLTSLIDLEIWDCPSMDVPTDGVWSSNLCKLTIGNLKKPISEWGPQKFPSTLVHLALYGKTEAAANWSQLSHLHLPSSLTQLKIHGFKNLETVSEGLQHLTSLQHLVISWCPKIKDLPETLLPSLLSLEIRVCPNLEEGCRNGGGAYWPKISHIPKIEIDEPFDFSK